MSNQINRFVPATKPVAKPFPSKGPVNRLPEAGTGLTPEKAAKMQALGSDRFEHSGKGRVVAKIQLPKDGPKPSAEELAAMKAKIEAAQGAGEGQVVAKIRVPKDGTQPSAEELAALKEKIEAQHAEGGRPTHLPNWEAMGKLKEKLSADAEGQSVWSRVQAFFTGKE